MARNSGRNPAASAARQRPAAYNYRRARDLPRLLPLFEAELETPTLAQHLALIALIRRALWRERMRGTGGHWTYDLARHAALLAAYQAEREMVRQRHAGSPSRPSGALLTRPTAV